MATPWYYKLYWKMEGWLQSRMHTSLSSERGFSSFFGKHGDVERKESALRVKAGNASRAQWLHQKPIDERIRQGYF